MRYRFPHYSPKPKFIQPDYAAWAAVQIGMSRAEVIALLGKPIKDEFSGNTYRPTDPYYAYGYLQMPMIPHPRTYQFLIGFNDDVVSTKADPFHGRFSPDGVPTQPEIIIPLADSVFSHYPRIIDCRWYPSSGVYPMTYSVEVGFGNRATGDFRDEIEESELAMPFFMTSFVGANAGRLRVKAKNKLGESDWSDFRHFRFTV